MAVKVIDVPNIGSVSFQKRRGARSIRLKIGLNGRVVVTQPFFVPYRTAINFVQKHADWIISEQQTRSVQLHDGLLVGRTHILRFEYDPHATQAKSRVGAAKITVRHRLPSEDETVQQVAQKAAIRALKQQAAHFLPKRLKDIAAAEGYDYSGCSLKQLTGRWGSCDQNKHITLNIFLMELPTELIDYVILHELAHTRALHHGPDFWKEFEAHLPDAKVRRKLMKQYHPAVPAKRVS